MDQAGKLKCERLVWTRRKAEMIPNKENHWSEAAQASVALSEGLCSFWWSQRAVMGE